MSIVQVETVSATATTGACTATLGTATTAGELVVVVASSGLGGTNVPTISDSASSAYTPVFGHQVGGSFGHYYLGLWVLQGAPSGITQVVSTLTGGDSVGGLIVGHYTGLAASSALDQTADNLAAGDGTSPWNSPPVTTTVSNELLIGACYALAGTGNPAFAASGGWTLDRSLVSSGAFDGGNGTGLAYMHQIVSTTQTNVEATGTNGAATPGTTYVGIATFKASGGGGGGAVPEVFSVSDPYAFRIPGIH